MESAFFSVLTEQHSPSNFCHSKFHTQCHLGFLEMKQRVGLTQRTYPMLGTYVFQGETRYNYTTLMLFYYWQHRGVFIHLPEVMNLRFPCLYFIVFPKQSVVQGTTFVLQKSPDARQILLSTISAGTGVEEVHHCKLHYPLSR